MNEQNGHEMLVARCQALEEMYLNIATMFMYETATSLSTPEEIKSSMEKEIERLAPGCGHIR